MRLLALVAAAFSIVLSGAALAADVPRIRAALQLAGTVNWEVDTIRHNGFDKANGFSLDVRDAAGTPGAQVALIAGEVDVIVSDWLWVARERARGRDLVFIPYSRAVGALLVPRDSPAGTIADLRGGRIGIAGGPIDKSWIILRAYARQVAGLDLAAATEQVFAAPPLIYKAALGGEFAAALNFWHFGAKMEAAGMRRLVTVQEAAAALGLDPDVPLLGYVVRGEVLRAHPGLADGLAAASAAAKARLASDPAAWERIRPLMNAGSEAEFAALRDGFLEGIPKAGRVDSAAAGRLLALLAELGGAELVGDLKELPDGVFHDPGT